MAFELPRNRRALRFTGDLRVLATPRPRPARPLAPPPRSRERPPVVDDSIPTPFLHRPSVRAGVAAPPDSEEELPTQAFDRDALDVTRALPATTPRPRNAPPSPLPSAPRAAPVIPPPVHSQRALPAILAPTPLARASAAGPSLALWLCAAILAGMVSFKLAPEAKQSLEQAYHRLER